MSLSDERIDELCETIHSRIGQSFDGECHLTEAEACEAISLLSELKALREGNTASDAAAAEGEAA